MELRQIEYFVAVAEEASFTRAADRLYVTQPGVSAQVRLLEQELGETLLDRTRRTVRLTQVGAAVLPYARAVLAGAAAMRLTVDEMIGQVRGRVAAGMMSSITAFDLPGLLASFHQHYPGIDLTLSQAASDHLIAALRAGQLDAAFLSLAGDTPTPGLDTLTVVDPQFVVVAAPGDPLVAGGAIELSALRERTVISLPRGTGLRTALEDACARAGFQPRVSFEAADPPFVAQLAGRGLGVAVLPSVVAAACRDAVQAVPISRPQLVLRIALAWRSEGPTGPATRAFIGHVRSAAEALAAETRAAEALAARPKITRSARSSVTRTRRRGAT